MRNGKLLLLIPLLLVLSCEEQAAEEQPDMDFLTFHKRFLEDSAYQLSHIQFPLKGQSAASSEPAATFRWERQYWQIHQPLDKGSGFFSEFVYLGDDLVIESIIHVNGAYGMERRYSKLGGDEWLLIYYADLHVVDS